MQKKQSIISPKNILQDTSVSVFPNTSAFNMLNLRAITTGENTSLCLTNEKGNSKITIPTEILPNNASIIGTLTINNNVVLFATKENGDNPDYIIKTNLIGTNKVLYNGNLGFKKSNPIESIGIYETETVLKVYWVDGENLPRVININSDYFTLDYFGNKKYKSSSIFDFNPSLNKSIPINLKVEILNNSNGVFSPSVILYALSYYTSLGQLSSVVYQSSLYYISQSGRGLNPDGSLKSSLSFRIIINKKSIKSEFDYLRLYRISRTSLNAEPSVEEIENIRIADIDDATSSDATLKVYDTGRAGIQVDPKSLFFLGGDEINAKTITHKDNTLFLGNINNKDTFISESIKNSLRGTTNVEFVLDDVKTLEDNISYLNKQWIFNSNLNLPSNKITYFLKGETYRFGILLLSKTGKWSESIFLLDKTNNIRVVPNKYNDGIKQKPNIHINIDCSSIPEKYIAVRPVCVYPSLQDRNILCLGIVCPTVYNIEDRNDNSPYVQSSWFARPSYYKKFKTPVYNDNRTYTRGTPLEFRMVDIDKENSLYPTKRDKVIYLPSSKYYNGEISNLSSGIDLDTSTLGKTEKDFNKTFGIDKRIVTFHSPELDSNYSEDFYNLSLDGVKFKVVGFAPVKNTLSDIKILVTNKFVPNFSDIYNKDIEYLSSLNYISGYSLVNFPFWVDAISINDNETYPSKNKSGNYMYTGFPIYPWNRAGSLSNQGKVTGEGGRKSLLKTKTMSNLRVCAPSVYLNSEYKTNISKITFWNSDVISNKYIETWGKNLIYRGNIDKVLSFLDKDKGEDERFNVTGYKKEVKDFSEITSQDIKEVQTPPFSHANPYNKYNSLADFPDMVDLNKKNQDPIPILYKSTNHAVFSFELVDGVYEILPGIFPLDLNIKSESFTYNSSGAEDPLFWLSQDERKNFKGIKQHAIRVDDSLLSLQGTPEDDYNNKAGYYYIIGELYRDDVINKFGGNSPLDLSNNVWTVCGNTKYISEKDEYNVLRLIGDLGDTYYERYDHLKTLPLAEGNVNNVVDIVSFMCETRINIDGRYDINRGKKNNLFINTTNFNLFNKVYSQRNNFFNYPYIDSNKLKEYNFPNQIVWSRPKILGEEIDTWTSINTINSLDLDGDKGELRSLNRLNNEIYAFLDKGISRILYNSRAMINSSDGVPIEIANGGKVEGKVYINDNYGCLNKWSIAEVPSGIYFIDNVTNGIYLFNGSLILNISDIKGMYSWVKKNVNSTPWNPIDFNNIRTLYDSTTGDVYFTTKDTALAYNEKMLAFTSFYSYGSTSWLINLNDNIYLVNNSTDNKLWSMHTNTSRCNFFNTKYPYSIKVVANPDFLVDKIIDTLEFRTDDIAKVNTAGLEGKITLSSDYYPFLTIEVNNEYQHSLGDTSTLKKRFRTWRWAIPRAGRDRIRNPWSYIEMTCNKDKSEKELKLYDMILTYYI